METFDSDLKYLLPLADSRNLANLDQKLKKFLEQQATFSVSQARLLAIDAAVSRLTVRRDQGTRVCEERPSGASSLRSLQAAVLLDN